MIPAFIADRENRKRKGLDQTENRVGATVQMYSDPDDDETPDDGLVYECKGGSPPKQPSPMEEANAQMELERARARMDQERADREAARVAAEKQAKIEKARGIQSNAYNSAIGYGSQQVGARGYDQGLVDKYGLLNLYGSAIDQTRNTIAEDDLNPIYNTTTAFNDALGTAQGTYRGDLKRQLNDITGSNFSYDTFADTADDEILNAILGQGRQDALATIDAAKARGQLNDVGYGRALTGLDQQAQSASADLQDLGLGVLSGYRKDLDALRNTQLTDIGSADFSNPLDFSGYQSRVNDTVNSLRGRLSGDIYRATNDQSFFDPSSLISKSGAIQGYYNPTSTPTPTSATAGAGNNPLLDVFKTQDEQKKNPVANGVF